MVACVEDDSAIEKVEFYIDGVLKNTDTMSPYEWSFRKVSLIKHIIRKHTLMVKAYDDEGKTATESVEVLAIFL
ncbi:hypothetical protein KA005_37505 [bacterium]|nr:hypothetical protein [bacterium]